jgi:hypothetical protein
LERGRDQEFLEESHGWLEKMNQLDLVKIDVTQLCIRKQRRCSLENMAAHTTLADFLRVNDLRAVGRCNRRLREHFMSLFYMRARFCGETLSELPAPIGAYVRRVKFTKAIDLTLGMLPPQLLELELPRDYNQLLTVGVLPSSLKKLKFGSSFSQPLDVKVLPVRLESLELGKHFNRAVAVGVLPRELQEITFGEEFDQELVGVLPPCLKLLRFGSAFNRTLLPGVFPFGLQELYFGFCFDSSLIKGVLPATLLKLDLGFRFNHPLHAGVLPEGLIWLSVGGYFDQELIVPPRLTHLRIFSEDLCTRRKLVLPLTLKSLMLHSRYVVAALPSTLEYLVVPMKFAKQLIPSHLTKNTTLSEDMDCLSAPDQLPQSPLPGGIFCIGQFQRMMAAKMMRVTGFYDESQVKETCPFTYLLE